jgi:hypothetical protein
MVRRNEARREEMRGLLAEQETSGMSLSRFARERGMQPKTLYHWRRVLKEAHVREGFVEVQVVEEARPPGAITVELPAGVRVQVPVGFEESHLRRVIAALSSC